MNQLNKPNHNKYTPVPILAMSTTLDGTSALRPSATVTLKDSSKIRKSLPSLIFYFSTGPLMSKTKMVAERKLIEKMQTTGKPYLAPVQYS